MRRIPRSLNYLARLKTAARESRAIQGETLWAPPPAAAGIAITPESALSLAVAFACINVLATDLSSLPARVYRRSKTGGRDLVTDDPRSQILAWTPDGERTSMRFRQAMIGHVQGWGNGYAEIGRNGKGTPDRCLLLNPATTTVRRVNGALAYRFTAEDGGAQAEAPPSEVIHLAGFGFDGLTGYSPIRTLRDAFALGKAAEIYGSTFFGNSARASGFLKSPTKLRPEARKNLKESWDDAHGGPFKANRIAVLEGGLDFVKMSVDPDDAQFLQTRKFQVLEICRIYRVPPHKVMDLSEAHLSNVEAANLDYLTTVVVPWCEQIEQELTLKLFSPAEREAGYYIEHSLLAFLRGDGPSRAAFYSAALRDGWMNRDEVRARENLEPIGAQDGGEAFLVQAQMVPLAQAGVAFQDPAAPPAPAPAPAGEAPAEGDQAPDGTLVVDTATADVQATALNGAQVTALQAIVQSVADGTLPAGSAQAMIQAAFPAFTAAQIAAMVDPAAALAAEAEPTGPDSEPPGPGPEAPGPPPPPPPPPPQDATDGNPPAPSD